MKQQRSVLSCERQILESVLPSAVTLQQSSPSYRMASRLSIASIAMSHPPNNELSQVKGQSAMIAQHMIYHLLREQGIRLNGYTAGNGHSTHVRISRERSVREAIATLETSCAEMRHKYIREIEGLVNTLDISETQVYPSFLESCTKLMDDDIRWGRIAVLFFFSSVLAERLHREGQVAKIESLVGWLTTFINDNLSQWILEHGGWGAIDGAVNVDTGRAPPQNRGPGWLTLAAMGVGAVIVGALTIR